MLLASAPWSLLSSRPTSRAHRRSPRQGDPTGRRNLTDHAPRIHCHCLTRSLTHPASIHSLTQYSSTPRGSIYLPRIQSKRREGVTYNLLQPTTNQSCTNIINQQLTCGPRALCLPWPVEQCLVYLVYPLKSSIPSKCRTPSGVTPFSAAASSSTYRESESVGYHQTTTHQWTRGTWPSSIITRVPGEPGMVPTSTQTPHIKRVPNISHYRHQAVFVQPVQRQNHKTYFRYKTNSPLDYGLLALHIYSLQHPILETLCLP